uniref:Uncharacterized protein n=1 Tax=Acrobeloides nanus TaxID=290746 RepID=A0A914E557_9BILA
MLYYFGKAGRPPSHFAISMSFSEFNEKGRGRPSDFDDDALLETMEEDESLTTRMLAEQVDADHYIILRFKRPKVIEEYPEVRGSSDILNLILPDNQL